VVTSPAVRLELQEAEHLLKTARTRAVKSALREVIADRKDTLGAIHYNLEQVRGETRAAASDLNAIEAILEALSDK
jgi:hypothetical protein